MKKVLFFLVCLTFLVLPWHALLVTLLQCRLGLDVTIFRFWKEGMILLFLTIGLIPFIRDTSSWKSIIKKNSLLIKCIILYIVLCMVYLYIPHFHPEEPSFLGFRYDIFFLLAFLAGYLVDINPNRVKILLKYVFFTTSSIVVIFLLWYVFFDI